MRYIRLKKGKIVDTILWVDEPFTLYRPRSHEYIDKRDIVKEADTIEELCDYIFYKELGKQRVFKFPEECNFVFIRDLLLCNCVEDVKFAILTDKGLIYVAKMNKGGVLELL